MSKHQLSEVATSLLTLLNNMEELIVRSNKRQEAKEVMRAFPEGLRFLVKP